MLQNDCLGLTMATPDLVPVRRALISVSDKSGLVDLARDLVRHTMEFSDGHLHLDDTPGLGVTLDDDVLARYRVD